MGQTDKGSNTLGDGIRVQVFWQMDEDKSKAFDLDKDTQPHKGWGRQDGMRWVAAVLQKQIWAL